MATVSKKKAIIEGLKEAGRITLIGAVAAVVAGLTYFIGILDPALSAILGAFLLTVGKAADKFIHKLESTEKNGITGF